MTPDHLHFKWSKIFASKRCGGHNSIQMTTEEQQELLDNIQSLKNKNHRVSVPITTIQKVVCRYFEITIDELKGPSRLAEAVRARQISMYLGKMMTRKSLGVIGISNGRDHSTVLHHVKRVKELEETDPLMAEDIASIKAMIIEEHSNVVLPPADPELDVRISRPMKIA